MNLSTKTILFSDGTKKEMTFEETLRRFTPTIIQTMRKANNKFVFNAVEEDDFKQELSLELWRAYEAYEAEQGNCFSTYLFYKLQKGVRNATYSKYSKKNQGVSISMDAQIGDEDFKLADIFAIDDSSMDNIAFNELAAIICENINEEELDALHTILNKKEFSVQHYAEKHGITRQAANQRIIKLRKKIQKIISEQYLGIINYP